MKQLVKISTPSLSLIFFVVSRAAAQKHSETTKSNHQIIKNLQMNWDSTIQNLKINNYKTKSLLG